MTKTKDSNRTSSVKFHCTFRRPQPSGCLVGLCAFSPLADSKRLTDHSCLAPGSRGHVSEAVSRARRNARWRSPTRRARSWRPSCVGSARARRACFDSSGPRRRRWRVPRRVRARRRRGVFLGRPGHLPLLPRRSAVRSRPREGGRERRGRPGAARRRRRGGDGGGPPSGPSSAREDDDAPPRRSPRLASHYAAGMRSAGHDITVFALEVTLPPPSRCAKPPRARSSSKRSAHPRARRVFFGRRRRRRSCATRSERRSSPRSRARPKV